MKQAVLSSLQDALGVCNIPLTIPKDSTHGHYATTLAFLLAKEQGKNPALIAQDLAQKLEKIEIFSSVKVVGAYVNLYLSDSFIDKYIAKILKTQKLSFNTKKESILLEFLSANPTGPLHIGHARGAIYGDALQRIGRLIGKSIRSEYFVNDAGNQMQNLALSVLCNVQAILGQEQLSSDELYKGEYINELAQRAIQDLGKDFFAQRNIDLDRLKTYSKDAMLSEIQESLTKNEIFFDSFISEKELLSEWDDTLAFLQKNKATHTDDDGKIWLKTSEKNDEKDRVMVRENGVVTYLAGDLLYHKQKFLKGFDSYINIWGADHHGYIERVKAGIDFLGFDSKRLEILLSQMVSLLKAGKPYKMSKRAGNFILMTDVIDEIGMDNLRFIFLTKKSDTHLEFDLEVLQKQDSSNPVYYVQYAHARICSIFRKIDVRDDYLDLELENMTFDEKDLLFFASSLNDVLVNAFELRSPQILTEFLSKLATRLHKFYAQEKIMGNKRQKELLKMLAFVRFTLKTALLALGIKAKERM